MRASDPQTVITPGKIYHALGKKPDCGGCMKLFVAKMRGNDNFRIPLKDEIPEDSYSNRTKGAYHEGRQQSHRISQQGAQG
jgi:hypothetical protein